MDKPLIIKCNRMISVEELEKFRQIWNSQMAANEVVVLPYGFELAKVNVELLKKIRQEIYDIEEPDHDFEGFYHCQNEALEIIEKHIAELKGETE